MFPDFATSAFQDAALRQAKFAEPGEKHPGWRAPEQVPVPQHDGAQRAGQEDRDHSGHCRSKRTESQIGALRLNVLFLPRSWTTFWISTGLPLISESLGPTPKHHFRFAKTICWTFLYTILYKIKATKKVTVKACFLEPFVLFSNSAMTRC